MSAPRRDRQDAFWERGLAHFARALSRPVHGSAGYGRARGVLRIFQFAEYLNERGHAIHALRPDGVVRYEIAPLPAPDLPLAQQPVRRGEKVIILHFDNGHIAHLATTSPSSLAALWRFARGARVDLRILAELCATGVIPPEVRAVWATTVLYQALPRYGFHTRPSAHAPFHKLFMLGMQAIYGWGGRARLTPRNWDHWQMGEAWMSVQELQDRYIRQPARIDRQEPRSNRTRAEVR